MYEAHTYRDKGSWQKTLHEKALFFEKNTRERHNILGSYPSSVRLIPPKHYAGSREGAWEQIVQTGELSPGWTFDHGTTGISNVAHTSSWTGCLLTSQAFRVAFLRERYGEESAEYQEAYERANEIIHSIRILTLVSSQPGYLARGVALGHGISYEERAGVGTRDLWAQGAGEFSHLRYRGGPSHHNYDHVFRGLGIYYFVAADEPQKEKIREIVTDMSNWAHLKNDMIVMHVDGERISTELIGVQFAADTSGSSYWSNTQGEIWHSMAGLPRVHDFLFSLDYPWIAFAATDGGVYRTLDGGNHWNITFNQSIQQLEFSPHNSNILYATGQNGVYKSEDLGERDMGIHWRCISGDIPANVKPVFAVDVCGDSPTIYLLTRHGFYSKTGNAPEWTVFPQITRRRGFGTVDPIGGNPLWLRVDPHIRGRLFRAVETEQRRFSDVTISVRSPVFRELKPLADWSVGISDLTITGAELRSLFERLREFPIRDLRVDRKNPDVWYGLMETGVAVTEDAGKTWRVSREGLDIPRVHSIWTPRHSHLVIVGTPAGMYVSNDQGDSWTDTPLILQGEGAIRAEIGGIGYLTAYWMGRYHGFISEEEAHVEWWKG